MVTNRDVIFEFKEMLGSPPLSDDVTWYDRWIYFYLIRIRSYIIHQKLKKKERVSKFTYQDIDCLELEEENENEITNCKILKTKYSIPKTIGKPVILSLDNSTQYSYVDLQNIKHKLNYRYKSIGNKTIYTLRDIGNSTHIILYSNELKKKIKVHAIFEDPLEAYLTPDCNGKLKYPCKSYYDYEWKLDSDLTKVVLDMSIQKLPQMRIQLNDILNNSTDDIKKNLINQEKQ